MTYEKPEVSDFGSIAEHTYGGFTFWRDCDPGGSGPSYGSFWGSS